MELIWRLSKWHWKKKRAQKTKLYTFRACLTSRLSRNFLHCRFDFRSYFVSFLNGDFCDELTSEPAVLSLEKHKLLRPSRLCYIHSQEHSDGRVERLLKKKDFLLQKNSRAWALFFDEIFSQRRGRREETFIHIGSEWLNSRVLVVRDQQDWVLDKFQLTCDHNNPFFLSLIRL